MPYSVIGTWSRRVCVGGEGVTRVRKRCGSRARVLRQACACQLRAPPTCNSRNKHSMRCILNSDDDASDMRVAEFSCDNLLPPRVEDKDVYSVERILDIRNTAAGRMLHIKVVRIPSERRHVGAPAQHHSVQGDQELPRATQRLSKLVPALAVVQNQKFNQLKSKSTFVTHVLLLKSVTSECSSAARCGDRTFYACAFRRFALRSLASASAMYCCTSLHSLLPLG
jgi:hypothetical protein